jgi:hypothetical protein
MNPLTHAYFALNLFKDNKLTQDQKDHLIVGSIIPDISQFGLANYYRTHTGGIKFLQQAKNPLERYLALGIISHGEEPAGLDFHSHKKKGYIDLKQKHIVKLLKRYKRQLGKVDDGLIHNIIEFAIDYLIAKRNPSIIRKVRLAFLNPKIPITITKFFKFLHIPQRKTKKIKKYFKNKHFHNFFYNFHSLDGMADNWLNLKFFHNLRGGRHLPFTEKIKKLTQLSYYNLKRKIRNKNIIGMFEETSSYLSKDYYQFLSRTQKQMNRLKNELLKDINSQKS